MSKASQIGGENAPKPREVSKQETREALILAGIAAFSEEGLDGPSLDSICARAGYTRGAFYVHFESRDDLIAACMHHVLGTFLDAITSERSTIDLERTVAMFAHAANGNTFPLRGSIPFHQFLAACARSESIRTLFVSVLEEGVRRVAQAGRAGQAAGTLRDDVDPERIAKILTALSIGLVAVLEVKYPLSDVEPFVSEIIKLLRPPTPR